MKTYGFNWARLNAKIERDTLKGVYSKHQVSDILRRCDDFFADSELT